MVLGKHEVMCEFAGEPKLAALHTAVQKALCEMDQGTFPIFTMTMMPEGLLLSDDSSVAALSSGSTIEVIPIDREEAKRILEEKGVSLANPDAWHHLLTAVHQGDTGTVRLMLLAGGNPLVRSWNCLHLVLSAALAKPDLPMCRILLACREWKEFIRMQGNDSWCDYCDTLQSRDRVQILVECEVTEFSKGFFYRAAGKGRDWVFAAFMPQEHEVLCSSLHIAVNSNSLPTVRTIASHGTLQQSSFTDALLQADSFSDRTDMRRLLVELSVRDGDGGTCLMQVASKRNVTACEEILAYLKANNRTPDVTSRDSKGWTCLMHAVSATRDTYLQSEVADKVCAQLVVLLASHGADPSVRNNDGLTALLIAITAPHGNTAAALLAAGADPSVHNNDGLTALHVAVTSNCDIAFAALLAAGACPNTCDRNGVPLLHKTSHAFMFQTLLASPRLDLNVRDSCGRTRLMLEARSGRMMGWCRALLEKGADVGAQDNDGWTCLGHAAASGDVKVVTLLLDHGAGVNDGAVPPLLVAVNATRAPVCRLLLERGADVTKPAADGRTCVSVAAGLRRRGPNRGAKTVQALVREALEALDGDDGDDDSDSSETEAETAQGAVGETPGSGSSKRKREDDEEDPAGNTHACAVCGAVALASGEPFPSAESVLRHASSKHRMRRSEYIRRFG